MKTFYHQSCSLSSIDEGVAERQEHQYARDVVVEMEGELDTSPLSDSRLEESMSTMELFLASRSASTHDDATRRRHRRRHRRTRSSSTTSEDSIGSLIGSGSGSSRRISYECHPDEILEAIAASTSELSIDASVIANDNAENGTTTTASLPRRGMQNYRSGGRLNCSSMLSLISSDLDDSINSDREDVLNVLGALDEAILRSRAGRVRRSSSRCLSSRRSVLAEVVE